MRAWRVVAQVGMSIGLMLATSACTRPSDAENVAAAGAAKDAPRGKPADDATTTTKANAQPEAKPGDAATPGARPAVMPPPVSITVAPVATRRVERTVSVVGTLAANEQADLASEAEGQVIAVSADLGDRVKAGQILARVRGDVVDAKLREAEAAFDKAAADEARARPLRAQGIISEQEAQQVAMSAQVARARRDALRVEASRTMVRAPFDGSVAERVVSVGNYVRSGTVIFRLVQDDPLKFRGEIPERETPNVASNQEIRVTVDAFRGETFLGHIARIGAAADPAARSVAFEATVRNTDRRLRPGFFGHGEIVVRFDERALAVPRNAIITFAGVTKLFSVEEGKAREHEVTLGVDLGDGWVEVTQGVTRGIPVVTTGLSKLVDGAPVVIRDPGSPGA
jgi:membrane fusion protein, multidrug efflux system